ncbi:MAG: L,D-transpeptidase family protein, partial [Microbacterium sp.]
MTDLISAPGAAEEAHGEDSAPTAVLASTDAPTETVPPTTGDQPLAWAPIEPTPKKRRLGLWIGLGLGAIA